MAKISKDMTIGEIIKISPAHAQTLMNFGMGCIGCPSAQSETLKEASLVHGIDLDRLISALNDEKK
ncbi:DUF1858 domain-containing protein [Clostridium sp. WILCCON 0269]|uniref:DUF1858 domain-containing protein n=1 Tax=Candidatus Clostridium eludens TaxID=3381663 RepID=A0ABW8SF96_9CLOT